MAQISELLKALQQGNGGFTKPRSPFQLDAPAPAAPPTVGPTLARDPRAVPMLGGFAVQGEGAERFPLGVPDDQLITQPTPSAPAQQASAQPTPDRGVFTPTGGGGFNFSGNVPVPADREPGFIPTVETAAAQFGTPEFLNQGQGGVAPAPAVEPSAAGATPAPLADTNTGVSPTALGAPTSGSGIGTSVVNDVNFLQEGMRQAQGMGPSPQAPAPEPSFDGLTTAGGQPLAEFLAGGQQLDPQGRMIDPNVDRSDFERESLARDVRQEEMLQSRAQARQDQRGGGDGADKPDFRALARAQGATGSAVNAQAKQLEADFDLQRSAKADGGLTDFQKVTAAQRQQEIDMKVASGMEEKAAKKEVEFEESRNNVRSTQDSFNKLKPVAEEIAELSGTVFTEGALGWAAAALPMSTNAGQIERLTTEFEGSAFLQGLIEAKAKGATFGALSEQEGNRILGQWGTITSPKSTNEQRIKAINNMLSSIQRSSERAAADHKEKFPNRSATPETTGGAPSTGGGAGQPYSDNSSFEIID